MTKEQLREIILDEFRYWRDEKTDVGVAVELMQLGIIGSLSNVLAALEGFPAPWHRSHPLHAINAATAAAAKETTHN
jgi:hypothetical protein